MNQAAVKCCYPVAVIALDLGAHPLSTDAAKQLPAFLLDMLNTIYRLHPAYQQQELHHAWATSEQQQVTGLFSTE